MILINGGKLGTSLNILTSSKATLPCAASMAFGAETWMLIKQCSLAVAQTKIERSCILHVAYGLYMDRKTNV